MNRVAMVMAVVGLTACQQAPPREQAQAGPAPGTPEWKIQNAMSAAPEAVSSAATIMEWGATPETQPTQLRAGTNGWTCFADNPGSPGNDPMCVDQNFIAWATAWMSHTTPDIKGVGFAYMLQGGSDASNTDPFKMQPDPGAAWVDTGPHVMMVTPNVASLAGLPTDHTSGGPYIMWQNTPYAHVMLPVK